MLVLTTVKGEFIQIGEAKVWIYDRGRKVRIDAPPAVRVRRQRTIDQDKKPPQGTAK